MRPFGARLLVYRAIAGAENETSGGSIVVRKKTQSKAKTLLRNDAYEQILMAIIVGDLEPGARVDEKQLMRDFRLGQAAVRDALYRLSLEGLVERHARIGTRIGDLGLRELQDVFEARVLIEGYAAALAAHRATPEDLAAIRASYDGYEAVVEARDVRALVMMDRAFHRALAAACKNTQIEQAALRLHNNAARFWCFGLKRTSIEINKKQISEHLQVVNAIEKKDMAEIDRLLRGILGHFPDSRFFMFDPLRPGQQPAIPEAAE